MSLMQPCSIITLQNSMVLSQQILQHFWPAKCADKPKRSKDHSHNDRWSIIMADIVIVLAQYYSHIGLWSALI